MKNWPWVNAEIRGEQIVRKNYVNLGIAVALEGGQGLIVPVIKNAEGLNLLGLARSIADIAERSRNKKLMPDDVQGGTFTITNPGGWGRSEERRVGIERSGPGAAPTARECRTH